MIRSGSQGGSPLGASAVLLAFSILVLAAGCFRHPHLVPENMPCVESGVCPEGYICNRQENRCHIPEGGVGDVPFVPVTDSGATETEPQDGLFDGSSRSEGADARETGRPGSDGPDASTSDHPQTGTPDSAEPDVPTGVLDASEADVPIASGGMGGNSGAGPDAGSGTGTGGAGPGGAGGTGGRGGLSTGGAAWGGTVSSTGGASVGSGGVVLGGSSTGGAGGVLIGGTSASAGTTSPPDAAVGGTISTGGSGGAGGTGTGGTTASPPNLVASPDALDFGDVVRGAQSTRIFTLTNQGGDSGLLTLSVTDTLFSLLGGGTNPCGAGGVIQLVHNASCTVTVLFNPTNTAALGTASGAIQYALDGVSVGQVQVTGKVVCPKYQQDDGTGICVQGDYPMGNDPIPSSGCGTDGVVDLKAGAPVGGGYELLITSSGQARQFIVDIPAGYDPNTPNRLFFCFHPMGSSAEAIQEGHCYSLMPLAEAANVPAVFVAPQADGSNWQQKDHVLFEDLLAHLKAKLCIDTSRVFATGFNIGGAMTYSLSVSHPKDLRAGMGIAPFNYNQYIPDPKSHLPIAWMQTTGMNDNLCPWVYGTSTGAKFIAIEKGTDNGCTLPDPIPTASSGGAHLCVDFSGCKASYPTKVCTFDGGHTDSDSDPGSTANWIPQESWDFFAQF